MIDYRSKARPRNSNPTDPLKRVGQTVQFSATK